MQIWGNQWQIIYMYFDEEQVYIYPNEDTGFDKIYSRVFISNLSDKLEHFLCDYKVRSLKPNNAVMLKFEYNLFAEFISYLKVFEENHYDAKFKLMAEKQ